MDTTTSSRNPTRSAVILSKRFRIGLSAKLIGHLVGLACLMGTLSLPVLTHAQVGAGVDTPDLSERRPTVFELSTGFEQRFETDIDDGGEVEELRVPIRLGYATDLSEQWRLGIRLNYVYNQFDFSGNTGFGGLNPWEDIHLFNMTLPVLYRLSPTWRIAVVPLLSINAESGADAGDGLSGGGIVVALYRFGPHLSLGLGIGALSQIEDDAQFLVLPLIYWQMTPNLTLASQNDPVRGYGAKLTYLLGSSWQAGLGIGFQTYRFRLDDDNVAPNGVGEVSSAPFWASIAYVLDERLTFEFSLGAAFGRELKLEDENGNEISEQDVDSAPTLGLTIKGMF